MALTETGTAKWGLAHRDIPSVSGVLVSLDRSREMSVMSETDEDGAVCGQFVYDEKFTISCTVQAPAESTPPNPGDQIEIEGRQYYVLSAQEIEANQAFRKISIVAESYKNCTNVEKQGGGEES